MGLQFEYQCKVTLKPLYQQEIGNQITKTCTSTGCKVIDDLSEFSGLSSMG